MVDMRKQGKRNRINGANFERKVRADLESKGWVVDKWSNNVEFEIEAKEVSICPGKSEHTTIKIDGEEINSHIEMGYTKKGKLITAKRKYNPFNKVLAIGTGFPDFIVFTNYNCGGYDNELNMIRRCELYPKYQTIILGVECKTNGKLDKIEKEKCQWLLDNNKFSKILIASKIKVGRKVEVEYKEFK